VRYHDEIKSLNAIPTGTDIPAGLATIAKTLNA